MERPSVLFRLLSSHDWTEVMHLGQEHAGMLRSPLHRITGFIMLVCLITGDVDLYPLEGGFCWIFLL